MKENIFTTSEKAARQIVTLERFFLSLYRDHLVQRKKMTVAVQFRQLMHQKITFYKLFLSDLQLPISVQFATAFFWQVFSRSKLNLCTKCFFFFCIYNSCPFCQWFFLDRCRKIIYHKSAMPGIFGISFSSAQTLHNGASNEIKEIEVCKKCPKVKPYCVPIFDPNMFKPFLDD